VHLITCVGLSLDLRLNGPVPIKCPDQVPDDIRSSLQAEEGPQLAGLVVGPASGRRQPEALQPRAEGDSRSHGLNC